MSHQKNKVLYRPVGLKEMELILESNCTAFPPRLPEQPFFYPVLNFGYAEQLARDWNTKDSRSGFVGFVTEFAIDKKYASRFEIHTVGAAQHQELWIPADNLNKFNQNIIGLIKLKAAYYGEAYKGSKHRFQDWYAKETFVSFYTLWIHGLGQDFSGEMAVNRNAILLNYGYWMQSDFSEHMSEQEKLDLLHSISQMWKLKFPDMHLLGSELLE